jgi:hypothetical protein
MAKKNQDDNFNKAFDELNEIHKKMTEMTVSPEELKILSQRAKFLITICEEVLFQVEEEIKESKKNLK